MRKFQVHPLLRTAIALSITHGFSSTASAEDTQVTKVVIQTSRPTQLGLASSASEGTINQKQLEARTVYRPGELLEATPGLIVSQHSGEGKANQFFLRGINLDHGTDLRTSIDGMLVNQRSHAHGQGWTDLNFMIPELTSYLEYTKGPFRAEQGDFSAAGSIHVRYVDSLPQGLASLGLGQHGYKRTLLADSKHFAEGHFLYALELLGNDGPFTLGDKYRKINSVVRYSRGDESNGANLSLMAYRAHWKATDQIPTRALESGILKNRFDTIDTSDGGKAERYSLSSAWVASDKDSSTRWNAYVVYNQSDLFSNFTYFLNHPDTGDQFSQPDRRISAALNASHAWKHSVFSVPSESSIGLQLQIDKIHNGLFDTQARKRIATTRTDDINQSSLGLYFENTSKWLSNFRSVIGLRSDSYHNKVDSQLRVNSGTSQANQVSPKLSLIFGPWQDTEAYLNVGRGFHSNDARGTTIRVDPKDPQTRATAEQVLAPARGIELGLRSEVVRGLQSSVAIYQLNQDSELLFAGDAGSTRDTGRPSQRRGFEFSNYYKLSSKFTIDADVSLARARFRDKDVIGQYIPGAIEGVGSLALTVDNYGPWFGALQMRYFGPRALTEDNSYRSMSTNTVNARLGYKISPNMRLAFEVYNLQNRRDSAIDYAYQSRLPGEAPEGKFDIHFHPIESRSIRLNLNVNF